MSQPSFGLTQVCFNALSVELSGGNVSLSPVIGLKVFGIEGSALYTLVELSTTKSLILSGLEF